MTDSIEGKEKLVNDIDALLQEKGISHIRYNGVDYRLIRLPQNTNVLYVGGSADYFGQEETADEHLRVFHPPEIFVELDDRFDIQQIAAREGKEITQQTVDEFLKGMVEAAAAGQLRGGKNCELKMQEHD